MLVTTQWPLKCAAHLTSLVWVCVLWLPWKLNGAICAMIKMISDQYKTVGQRYYNKKMPDLKNGFLMWCNILKFNMPQEPWHGNALCITSPLWGESTGYQRIPLTKSSNAEFRGMSLLLAWFSLWLTAESICWVLLIYIDWATSPWWLQMFWCQTGNRPSATSRLTWLWLYYHMCHTVHVTQIVMLQPLKKQCLRKFGRWAMHWFLCYWWNHLLTAITHHVLEKWVVLSFITSS